MQTALSFDRAQLERLDLIYHVTSAAKRDRRGHFCAIAECFGDADPACYEGCDHTAPVYNGNCFANHRPCGIASREETQELEAALAAGDITGVIHVLDISTTIRYNTERNAIQFFDCKQLVVRHIPLNDRFVVALEQ